MAADVEAGGSSHGGSRRASTANGWGARATRVANRRRQGPRTLGAKSEEMSKLKSGAAIHLLRKRDTSVKKIMMTKGKLNKQKTAKELIARVAFDSNEGSIVSASSNSLQDKAARGTWQQD
jgi:hypothetical protein